MSNDSQDRHLSRSGWVVVVVLTVFLAAALVYAANAWVSLGTVAMSGAGWLFLVLGVLVTLGVGGGLMWLVFYSSRHDYDR